MNHLTGTSEVGSVVLDIGGDLGAAIVHTPATLVGAALVVACGAYLAVKERRGRQVPTTAPVDVNPKV